MHKPSEIQEPLFFLEGRAQEDVEEKARFQREMKGFPRRVGDNLL